MIIVIYIYIEWASAQVPPTPLIGGGYCREREGDGQQDRQQDSKTDSKSYFRHKCREV